MSIQQYLEGSGRDRGAGARGEGGRVFFLVFDANRRCDLSDIYRRAGKERRVIVSPLRSRRVAKVARLVCLLGNWFVRFYLVSHGYIGR